MRQASSRHRYSSFPPCCSPVPVVLCGSYAEQGSGGRHRPAIRQEIRRRRLKLSDNPTAPMSPCSSDVDNRSEEHTSELQSLMRISYAVFCLKKKHTISIKTN